MNTKSGILNTEPANKAGAFVSPLVNIVCNKIEGHQVFFAVGHKDDLIQKHHLKGDFYEREELEIIRKYFPQGGVFLDIGANVGNHTLFALRILGASKAIIVEPNKVAYDLLFTNIVLNSLGEKCDFSGIGLGLSDAEAEGMGISFQSKNIGGACLVEGEGNINTITGDAFIKEKVVDFIKIDVEGMEIAVLSGLKNTISKFRPPMFVEVDGKNDEKFIKWIGQQGYEIVDTFKRYKTNCNYMISPID